MKNVKTKIALILCTAYGLYVCSPWILQKSHLGIRINRTESLPFKFFFSTPFRRLNRNQYVGLHHSSTSNLLAKQIIGLPGDPISLEEDHIFVNQIDCGKAFNMTSSGEPLTPIQIDIVPEGYVFVHAPHSESFDSRYQQFGLIPITHLEETLWPIY